MVCRIEKLLSNAAVGVMLLVGFLEFTDVRLYFLYENLYFQKHVKYEHEWGKKTSIFKFVLKYVPLYIYSTLQLYRNLISLFNIL